MVNVGQSIFCDVDIFDKSLEKRQSHNKYFIAFNNNKNSYCYIYLFVT